MKLPPENVLIVIFMLFPSSLSFAINLPTERYVVGNKISTGRQSLSKSFYFAESSEVVY